MASLTDRTIQATKATPGKDEWLSDGGARGAGRLYLRVQPSGRRSFYYRYAGPQNERQSMALGEYSQKGGRACLTLTEARDKAGELSRRYQSGVRDLKGHLEAEQRARERALKADEEKARRTEEAAKQGSLRNLLNGYTTHLERAEKTDFRDVKGLFRLHLFEKFPDLADRKASEIKARDLRDVLAKLIDADKGRTAAKLRSYMRAAFSAAIKAENDPAAHSSLMGYGIESNPCDALPALSQFNVAGERTLTEEELGLYINGLEFYPKVTRCALKLALYLGGQRPSQLLRVTPADVDLTDDGGEIRIRDGKGARKTPRLHVLPLVGTAREVVQEMMVINSQEKYLFCNVKDTHVRIETMSEAVGELSTVLVECGRSKSPFQQRDIRRTCETLLAGMGISKDIRAQLLSHGLGGVQQRNYDRHEYTDEKRAALRAWDAKLEAIRKGKESVSNVVKFETARAA
jgi:integrase